jgi:DNA-binding PadR family transcriptional regulator
MHDHSDHSDRHSRGEHGRGRHGRHRARRGAIIGAVLTLLDERPMHGYELITELEERSEGRWRPSPGTMYPALKRMSARGLIASEEVDGKRQFELTDAGREHLALHREEQGDNAAKPWDEQHTGGRGDLRSSVAELIGQARQIGRFGSAEQIERARTVFDDAKRQLYAILAEPPSDNDNGNDNGNDSDDGAEASSDTPAAD